MKNALGPQRTIVVGAGIAGLAAAFRLQRAGHPVTVLEQELQVGGRMSTAEQDGYRIDRGAIWLSYRYEHMVRLLADADLSSEIVPTSHRSWGIVRSGSIYRLNHQQQIRLLRTGLLSWRSKLKAVRLLRDTHRIGSLVDWADMSAAGDHDSESAHAYSQRCLNQELLDYLIDPLCTGYFFTGAEDIPAISALAIIKSFIGAPEFNFDHGIDTLARRLGEKIPVKLGAHVTEIGQDSQGVFVRWHHQGEPEQVERAAGCIVAVPGPAVPALVPGLPARQREYLQALRYQPSLIVSFGLTRPPDEPASYLIVPPCEYPNPGYIAFNHNIAPGRVPPGKGLVSLNFRSSWAREHWNLNDDTIVTDALASLNEVLPNLARHCATHREMVYIQRWERAILARPVGGYSELRTFVSNQPPFSPIQLAGDYFAFSSTNAALASGERAAQQLHQALVSQPDHQSMESEPECTGG